MGMMEDKVVIVTGAGRGIGRGIAILMAEQGAKVVVNDLGGGADGEGEGGVLMRVHDPADWAVWDAGYGAWGVRA